MGQVHSHGDTSLKEEIRFSFRESGLKVVDDESLFLIYGKHGEAEIFFDEEDDITGCIEGDFVHYWPICNTLIGVRSAIKKITDFIG